MASSRPASGAGGPTPVDSSAPAGGAAPPTASSVPAVDERLTKIRAAFAIFDPSNSGTIPEEEVPTVLRSLDIFVSDKDFVERVLVELHGDEPKPFVRYERFEEVVLRLMDSHEFDPDGSEVLMAAFRALDPEARGYIEADRMRALLQTMGEPPFSEKEVDAFLKVAVERDSSASGAAAGAAGGAAGGASAASLASAVFGGGAAPSAAAAAAPPAPAGPALIYYEDWVALVCGLGR